MVSLTAVDSASNRSASIDVDVVSDANAPDDDGSSDDEAFNDTNNDNGGCRIATPGRHSELCQRLFFFIGIYRRKNS